VANFAVHGRSLAWAAGVSIAAVHAVALGGFVVRMAAVAGIMFALRAAAPFFSPLAFGLAVVGSTAALLVHEARLLAAGVGRDLDIPPDPAAARAGESLRVREAAG
ncbi:MAG: hypothetical protein M3245_05500, partial [Actinomycetota bacterium]|nr:hypothetical protein [Actinomycetota bacterium]